MDDCILNQASYLTVKFKCLSGTLLKQSSRDYTIVYAGISLKKLEGI